MNPLELPGQRERLMRYLIAKERRALDGDIEAPTISDELLRSVVGTVMWDTELVITGVWSVDDFTPLEERRNADDYPRNRADALDVVINWPAEWLTERHLIAAQQLLRTPPDTVE